MRFKKKRLFFKRALETFIREGEERKFERIYIQLFSFAHVHREDICVNFRRKNERNGRAAGKYSKLGVSEERGCKGIPFTCRDHEWEGGVRRAEITRSKGRSVALCPLTGGFYSELCLRPFIDSIRRQSIYSLIRAIIAS